MSAIPGGRVNALIERLKKALKSGERYPACATPYITRKGPNFYMVLGGDKPDVKIETKMEWAVFQRAERLAESLA